MEIHHLPTMHCSIVDVFAERPLAGNQLAVVRNCAELDTATMLAITREVNFSETTFVIDEMPGEARVRIFTPDRELPFAGHPTLGTAWVLGRGRDRQTLHLGAGQVPVDFGSDGIAWMRPPAVELGEFLDPATAAALTGLDKTEIDSRYPCRHAAVGPRFLLIGLRSLESLRRMEINRTVKSGIADGVLGIFAFANEAYNEDADFAARMISLGRWLREDPATGSANTAFAAYLRSLGVSGRIVVEQGFEIERPSRLYLEVADEIRVGGRVHPVLTGTLNFRTGD